MDEVKIATETTKATVGEMEVREGVVDKFMSKQVFISQLLLIVALVATLFVNYQSNGTQTAILSQKMGFQEIEIRLLQQELAEEQRNGTYEQGYENALVRTGRGSGTFADGYDAAVKVLGNTSYADGYHNAITQFGYAVISDEAKRSLAVYQEQQKSEIQNVGLKTTSPPNPKK